MDNFVHLHGHSDHSALDGACSVDDIIDRAIKLGQPAIAITEHGNVDSALKLYNKCLSRKIKPILGCEMYLAEDDLKQKSSNYHITVLCKNFTGWKNLLKLVKIANVDGFYYKPRTDVKTLAEHREGLIILSGCIQGKIGQYFLNGQNERAAAFVDEMKSIFGEDFYIEIQNHGLEHQQRVMPFFFELSRKYNVKTVATNDYHYITKEDWITQEILICEAMKRPFNEHKKTPQEFYIKTREEMEQMIPDKASLDATIEIANKVNIEFPPIDYLLPKFNEVLFDDYIRSGKRRYRELFKDERYQERLDKEIQVIKNANLVGYFLTVHDFIAYCKTNDIMVGPGRGSVGGCLVAYLLGITAVDPIKYDLMFTRFYNAGRKKSLPDIDIDFAAKDIDIVLGYIKEKYGYNNVCHIGTFNTYAPKGAIKAICRVFDVPFKDANTLTDLIDSKAKSLKDELRENEKVKDAYYKDKTPYSGYLTFKEIFDYATKIEGLISHKGVHAAGIIISPIPLDEIIPVRKEQNSNLLVSCWEMKDTEAIGLVKYDFLRLDNLDAIKETLNTTKLRLRDIQTEGDSPLVKRAYTLITKTDNTCIFQLSGAEGSRIANRLNPKTMEDIAIAITLNRPGCINNGIHEKYIKRKNGEEEIDYPHPLIKNILKDTYGLMIYQEQIIQICMKFANFSEIEADSIRKAMGKKDAKLMKSMNEKFISGAIYNGVKRDDAERLWEQIFEFSEYSFNHCIDGDCYITRDNKARNSYTIAQMYDMKNNPQKYYKTKQQSISQKYKHKGYGKAKNLIGQRIFTDYIRNIYYQGKREVFLVTLENGQTISTTDNHKFPVYLHKDCVTIKQLKDIVVGEYLFIVGNYEKTKDTYPFSRSGLQIIKGKQYVNTEPGFPKGETNPGYIDGSYIEFEKIKKEMSGISHCQICGDNSARLEHHHINGLRYDNRRENIIKICPSCHKKEEYKNGRKKKFSKGTLSSLSKIVSIKSIGIKDVYDIEMENEPHNLFVNGIATCNSHAVGYAYISYYTAYLKANYKVEYMCAMLNTATTDQDKLRLYLNECKAIGVDVKPPNVNKSSFGFTSDNGQVIYGLKGIKGLGDENVTAIISNRNNGYKDVFEFATKNKIGSNVLSSLIYSGALDGFGYNRATLAANIEFITKAGTYQKKIAESGRRPLFEVKHSNSMAVKEELDIDSLSEREFDTLQAYVSVDPLARYRDWIEDNIDEIDDLTDLEDGMIFKLAGYVQSYQKKESKNGNLYLEFSLYTDDKTWRVLVFKDKVEPTANIIQQHKGVWIKGTYKEGIIIMNNIGRLYEHN